MSKKFNRALALLLAAVMVMSLAACNGGENSSVISSEGSSEVSLETSSETPSETSSEEPSEPVVTEDDGTLAVDAPRYNPDTYDDESAEVYEAVLGDFYEEYTKAKAATNQSERWAMMALAEGKLLGSGVMIPLQSRGGNYAITRVAPRSINSTLWGSDNERYHNAIIVKGDFLTVEEVNEIRAQWGELRGTGTFDAWVKEYLTGKGHELNDEYNMAYSSDPNTWDAVATSREADTEKIIQTYDGLYEYDDENEQKPALATSYEVSDDGLTYTFHIREGVIWTDSQGRKVADVKADDFVAGMQHMMDTMGGLEYLVGPDGAGITGADAYINGETTDFTTVGVKAPDDYTLVYTLDQPCSFFMTMLGYSVFAPMSREYYTSQGGKFGDEFDAEAADYLYGKDPDHIAYNGPFLITNATAENTIVFKANENYWNKDAMNIKSMTWYYNDGTDALKNYNDAKAETIAGCGLTASAVEQVKADGLFDDHVYTSSTNATSFMGFFNVNRYAFANFNDETKAVSAQTLVQAERTRQAMSNVHFRRALLMSLDRGAYNAQSVGEELKLTSLINSYVPGNFVSMEEDVTVDVNGTATTFPAGTYYGEIMQAQLDADGVDAMVWNPEMEGGIGSSAGFDGWYNPTASAEELATAVEELAAEGLVIDADNPIYVDLPTFTGSEQYANRAEAFKQSVESVTDSLIIVNKVECATSDDWYYAGYYYSTGNEANFDICDLSGWGPDYGDPQTYLDTMQPDYAGYMVKALGVY